MQKTLLFLVTALFIQLGVPKSHAAPNISVDFFYDQLGDYGDWVEVGEYGYGWQPRDVDENWRPYSDGGWAYTEAGWTWVSDEPYGWAVYHYGRWARIERKGWVWIPGTEWAPAWVSWRRSAQHVGWAPLPPEASFRRGVGFSGWVDSYYDIGPSAYRFVEVRNFGAPQMRTVFIEPRENITIIRQTTNVTQINYVNNVIHNGGPRYEDISRQTAEPIRRLRLDRRVEIEGDRSSFRGEQMRARVEGDSLRVFAPGFDARAGAPPRKLAAKIENVEVNRGWKDAGAQADVEKLRVKVRDEARPPKSLPPKPKFERLADQAVAPDAQSATEKPALPPAGEKPRNGKMKDGRTSQESPAAPVASVAEPKGKPVADPVATETPVKPQKPGKTGKVVKNSDPDASGQPPAPVAPPIKPEAKSERTVPPGGEPRNPEHKGKNRNLDLPPPTPVDPVEPKGKKSHPEAGGKPPGAEQPAPRNERIAPPGREPSRETPPAAERPHPKAQRGNPPNAAPGNGALPAPDGDATKAKPGKGKGKDDKKPQDDAPKPQ